VRHLTAILVLVAAAAVAAPVRAVDVESLMSPGPLITAHQRKAQDCRACHQSFDRDAENDLCLVCHEPVALDIEASLGLHGHLPAGPSTLCRSCHTEHKGADAAIVVLLPESFDHRRTDMPLEGAHTTAACGECHPVGKPHRDAPNGCIDCHREDDTHKGSLGNACENCHAPAAWTTARFDHATTRFPLKGRHADTDCALCHPQERFDATPTDCASCHRFDDAHRGRLGSACSECHQPSAWKSKGFDHGRETRFALRGGHAALECGRCHPGDPKAKKLDSDCSSCHANDDDHRGRYGPGCNACHDAQSWTRSRFDHAKATSYELHGSHANLECELCHTTPVQKSATPKLCVDCHASVDVHAGAEGSRCEKCHSAASWSEASPLEHGLTNFPLLGLHQFATCEDCHVTHDFREASEDCIDCHRVDDAHRSQLGEGCALCHNPNGWARWDFDHTRQTNFVLNGAHRGMNCLACHRKSTPGEIKLSMECRGCHLQDSPHSDAFGRDCDRCHVDTSWKKIREGQ
jgi:hypothetical protein